MKSLLVQGEKQRDYVVEVHVFPQRPSFKMKASGEYKAELSTVYVNEENKCYFRKSACCVEVGINVLIWYQPILSDHDFTLVPAFSKLISLKKWYFLTLFSINTYWYAYQRYFVVIPKNFRRCLLKYFSFKFYNQHLTISGLNPKSVLLVKMCNWSTTLGVKLWRAVFYDFNEAFKA